MGSSEEVVALAKEAGLNDKALEAALGSDSRTLSLIAACRCVVLHLCHPNLALVPVMILAHLDFARPTDTPTPVRCPA